MDKKFMLYLDEDHYHNFIFKHWINLEEYIKAFNFQYKN